jgi:Integrase core domain
MIASLEHWLISAMLFRPDRRQHPSSLRRCTGAETKPGTTGRDFIAAHMAVIAGIDFFTVEVLTWRPRHILRLILHPSGESACDHRRHQQTSNGRVDTAIGRNATDASTGCLKQCRYVLHDRDAKFTESFRGTLQSAGAKPLRLPPQSPNLNALAERWVRSVKDECLGALILFGEGSLRRALTEFTEHYHSERPHQGKNNLLLFPTRDQPLADGPVRCNAEARRLAPILFPHRLSNLTKRVQVGMVSLGVGFALRLSGAGWSGLDLRRGGLNWCGSRGFRLEITKPLSHLPVRISEGHVHLIHSRSRIGSSLFGPKLVQCAGSQATTLLPSANIEERHTKFGAERFLGCLIVLGYDFQHGIFRRPGWTARVKHFETPGMGVY